MGYTEYHARLMDVVEKVESVIRDEEQGTDFFLGWLLFGLFQKDGCPVVEWELISELRNLRKEWKLHGDSEPYWTFDRETEGKALKLLSQVRQKLGLEGDKVSGSANVEEPQLVSSSNPEHMYCVEYFLGDVCFKEYVQAQSAQLADGYFRHNVLSAGDARRVGNLIVSEVPFSAAVGRPVYHVPHARWKGAGMGDVSCSYCGHTRSDEMDYCPECFASMLD